MICHSRRPTAAKLSLLIAVERSPLKAKNRHYDFRTKEAKRKKTKGLTATAGWPPVLG